MKYLSKIKYNAPVVLTFTILSFLAVVLGYFTHDLSTRLFFSVYKSSPFDALAYIRVFTHVIGHANFEHFISNFMIILLVGPMLEEKYGSKKLLAMIVFTAFVTGLMHMLLSNTALLGASGIAFMMILLASFGGNSGGGIPLTFILVAVFYIGNEILTGLSTADDISQLTHIIGGICGCGLGFVFSRKERKKTTSF